MKKLKDTKVLVAAALMASLTFVATVVLKFPTPAFGYVHIGDGFVLLSGLLLGPITGGLSAGIGSMLSDLLGGYPAWAPGTFVIKFLTAMTASAVFSVLKDRGNVKYKRFYTALAGIAGELVMIAGYFIYNIFMLMLVNSGESRTAIYSAVTQSVAEIPFNLMQGMTGMIVCVVLYPLFRRDADF